MEHDLYETDYYAWTQDQAARLRAGLPADQQHIAEELDQMGRSNKRELKNLAQRIMEHLLKISLIGGLDTQHWKAEMIGFRQQLQDLFEESPSLRNQLTAELLERCYSKALERLRVEYGAERFRFQPDRCPYSPDALLAG